MKLSILTSLLRASTTLRALQVTASGRKLFTGQESHAGNFEIFLDLVGARRKSSIGDSFRDAILVSVLGKKSFCKVLI